MSAWKNDWKFSNKFWYTQLRRWNLQAHQLWLWSVHRWRRHVVVKFYGFVTFSPFFRFLIQPTGRNPGLIRTLIGSDDAVRFFSRASPGLGAFIFTLRRSPAKKNIKILTIFVLGRLATEITLQQSSRE